MIVQGRQLVPPGARMAADAAPARRPFSVMDERQLIPTNMRGGPLETQTNIPSHMPLASLAARVVVPRDMPQTPLDWDSVHPDYAPLTIMDQRVIVPAATSMGEFHAKGLVAVQDLPDVLPPDVMTTGEVNLMVEQVEDPRHIEWDWLARGGSLAAHLALLLLIAIGAGVSPPPKQLPDISREQVDFLYAPPLPRRTSPAPAPPPPPRVRIDPRYVRQLDTINPNSLQPILGPKGPQPLAPEEKGTETAALAPAPTPAAAPAPAPKLQPPPAPVPRDLIAQGPGRGLLLPRNVSPGRALAESAQEALQQGSGGTQQFGGEVPGARNGGGSGEGYLGGDVDMLTPTEGVDFTSYLARVVASVKRNWFSVMPESARLGDQGRVILQFRIMRDGLVPDSEPSLTGASGKEPLDRAAMSSIRASSPFPPLPPAFSGPYIELRFMFLYNMPPNFK